MTYRSKFSRSRRHPGKKPAAKPRATRRRGTKQPPSGPARYTVQRLLGTPFPAVLYTKQAYSVSIKFVAPGSTGLFGSEHKFNLNSQYDFDQTLIGHQPYGRDTLDSLYSRYKVTGLSWDLMIMDPSQDGVLIGIVWNTPSDQISLTGNIPERIREIPRTRIVNINNTGSQKMHVRGHQPMYKMCQVTKLQFDADIERFSAVSSSNPAAIPGMRIAASNIDDSYSQSTITVLFKFNLETMWYQRKILATS